MNGWALAAVMIAFFLAMAATDIFKKQEDDSKVWYYNSQSQTVEFGALSSVEGDDFVLNKANCEVLYKDGKTWVECYR